MKFKIPLYAVIILLAAAVMLTYKLTSASLARRYQAALDEFVSTSETEAAGDQTIKLDNLGMEIEYKAVEDSFRVSALTVGGKAESAGLVIGDEILTVDGEAPTKEKLAAASSGSVFGIRRSAADGGSEAEMDITF